MQNLKLKILDMEIYIEKTMVYIEEHDTFVAFIRYLPQKSSTKNQILKMRIPHCRCRSERHREADAGSPGDCQPSLVKPPLRQKLALNNLKETIVND